MAVRPTAIDFRRFGAAAGAAVVLAVMIATFPVRAQQTPPPPGEPQEFTLPAAREFTLDNGLAVSLVPFGAVPKVSVELVVRAGNVDEAPDEIWLSDLLADLMREGTTTRTGEEISLQAASMGGSLDLSVSPDEMTIAGETLGEFAPAFLELVADVTTQPSLPVSELPRLKADMLRNLAISRGQQQTLAFEKFVALLYPDHPYGRVFPTETMVDRYTVEQLRGFYLTHVVASRAHLFVAGVFDQAAVERAIRQSFAGWRRGTPSAPEVARPRSAREIHIIDRPGAVQTTIYLGLPVIDPSQPDYVALRLTNALLGGAFSSRLMANLREDKGYSYSPYSELDVHYRTAYWAEVADVTTDVTGAAIREVFGEIDRLQAEPPGEAELSGIQNYLAGTFVIANSSRSGLIGGLRLLNLHGLPSSYLTEYVGRVHAITPADVQRIARTYLKDDEMTIVLAGDRAAILPQLEGIAPVVE